MPPRAITARTSIWPPARSATGLTTTSRGPGRRHEGSRRVRAHRGLLPAEHLPGLRVQGKRKELSTFVFHGGHDSFVEEFYAFLLPLIELGFTVIAFDDPGPGRALRQGIRFVRMAVADPGAVPDRASRQ
jgi:hypothetical protein